MNLSWFSCRSSILLELEFGNVGFCGGRKTRPTHGTGPESNPGHINNNNNDNANANADADADANADADADDNDNANANDNDNDNDNNDLPVYIGRKRTL